MYDLRGSSQSYTPGGYTLEVSQPAAKPPGVKVDVRLALLRARLSWKPWLWRFFTVVGPGVIVLTGDNDVGGFQTYTNTGAIYGFGLMWLMLVLIPVTYFCQEMVIRLGCATGQGHAAMIFKRFGPLWGLFSLGDLVIVNFATTITEFIGIAAGLAYFGIPPWASLALSITFLYVLVSTGAYKRWENVTLVLVVANVLLIPLVLVVKPNFQDAVLAYARFALPHGLTADVVFLMIAIVGTTIAPWQIFFQQSAIADKGMRIKDIPLARVDLLVGNVIVQVGAFALIVLGAQLYFFHQSGTLTDPAQVATTLRGYTHNYTWGALYAIALVNAGLIAAVAITLSSSWAVGEILNVSASLNRGLRDAPVFYLSYAVLIGLAGVITLIPGAPLQLITISVQVLAGIMLPATIVLLNLLLNDRALLGPNLVNRPWQNTTNWAIIGLLFVLSAILVMQTVAPNSFPKGP